MMTIDNDKLELVFADRGLLWKELCDQAGITPNGLRDIRQGKAQPKPATIGRLAKALGCNITEILKEGE